MKVSEKLKKGKPALSFEFFPPKTEEQEQNLFKTLDDLKKYKPDFASVTYGAMGKTREKTFLWARRIKEEFLIEPVSHLTCVAATKESIIKQLNELKSIGIENILALRGDPPEGETDFVPPKDGFHFAKDLIKLIKRTNPELCLGAAGFPEGHPSVKEWELDIKYLKEKIDAGAEYVITQLFFDNQFFFRFIDRCAKAGINVPIVPGIMPVTSVKQIKKMTSVCGATIPDKLLNILEEYADDDDAIQKIGIEHAVSQCRELLKENVPGIHFFVMNKSGPISKILRQIDIR